MSGTPRRRSWCTTLPSVPYLLCADSAPYLQKAAGYSAQAYLDYVAWEREVKRPDTPLVKGIFERAVKDHPNDIEVWEAYLEFLVRRSSLLSKPNVHLARAQHKIPEKESNLREVAEKAVRNLPSSVSLWTAYFRVAVRPTLSSAV